MCKRPNFVLFAIIFDGCTLGNKAKTYLFDFEHLDTLCLEFGIGNVEMGKFSLKFIFIEYSPLKTFNFKRFLSRYSNTTLLLLQFEWDVNPGIHWTHRMKAYHFHCDSQTTFRCIGKLFA